MPVCQDLIKKTGSVDWVAQKDQEIAAAALSRFPLPTSSDETGADDATRTLQPGFAFRVGPQKNDDDA